MLSVALLVCSLDGRLVRRVTKKISTDVIFLAEVSLSPSWMLLHFGDGSGHDLDPGFFLMIASVTLIA